jgi:hypothetical protein
MQKLKKQKVDSGRKLKVSEKKDCLFSTAVGGRGSFKLFSFFSNTPFVGLENSHLCSKKI